MPSVDDGTGPLTLRPADENDFDTIAEIWHASASLPGVGPPVMPSRDVLRRRLDVEHAAGWETTLAVRDGAIVGFVAIRRDQAVLAELFIRPASIGGGVGYALLAHAMAAMPDGFTLFTTATNTRARRFYERAGLVFLRDDFHPRAGHPVRYYVSTGSSATESVRS